MATSCANSDDLAQLATHVVILMAAQNCTKNVSDVERKGLFEWTSKRVRERGVQLPLVLNSQIARRFSAC